MPPPLTGLKEDVLYAVLYYAYSECLPRGMSEATCKACIKAVNKMPGFSKFSELCETFLKNTALKQRKLSFIVLSFLTNVYLLWLSKKCSSQGFPA
jgi:hypothetical protein